MVAQYKAISLSIFIFTISALAGTPEEEILFRSTGNEMLRKMRHSLEVMLANGPTQNRDKTKDLSDQGFF